MNRLSKIILVGFLVVSLASCIFTQKKIVPVANGEDVIRYVTETNNYKKWDLWPGKGMLYKGRHPHGSYLVTYVTKGAFKAISSMSGKIPSGEMIVKENYSPEQKLEAITVMYRNEGFDPAADDWFWLKFGPDHTIMKEGKVAGCIDCHIDAKDNDWLFTSPIK